MKHGKLLAMMAIAVAMSAGASAQDNTVDSLQQVVEEQQARLDDQKQPKAPVERASINQIWKQRKHITLSIGGQKLSNLTDKEAQPLKSSLALSLQTGRTYNLHKKPIANMIKIGLDWNQMELHFAKYKKMDDEDEVLDYAKSSGGPNLDDIGLSDLGFYQLDYGMAVGPSVQATPLYTVGNGWEFLKVYTHFHVIPSYSIIFLSNSDDTNLGYGYVTSFSWGIGVSYRAFALGFETRWGKGKYNTSSFSNDIVEGIGDAVVSLLKNDRTKYKTTSSKLTLSYRF